MRRADQPHSGRHRWGGEKSALVVLAALTGLIVLAIAALWLFGGDGETAPPGAAADSGSGSAAPPLNGEGPTEKSRSPKPSKSKDKDEDKSEDADKYTPGDNPHGAGEVCGSGFAPVDTLDISAEGTVLGTVHLLYNEGSGTNCVVTLKAVDIGDKTPLVATLEVKGGKSNTESGKFGYYAGPVKREAAGTCVKWSGSIDGHAADSGDWAHCG